jgi:SnoaL-like domain
LIDALNRRDVEDYLASCTDGRRAGPRDGAVEGAYRNPSGIWRFFADLQDTTPDFHVEIERMETVGGNVLAFEGGSASGLGVSLDAASRSRSKPPRQESRASVRVLGA